MLHRIQSTYKPWWHILLWMKFYRKYCLFTCIAKIKYKRLLKNVQQLFLTREHVIYVWVLCRKNPFQDFCVFTEKKKKISIAFDDVVFMRKFSNKRFKPIYWTFLSSWNCGPREQTCWLSIGFYSFFFLLHTFFEYCYTVEFTNFCFVLKRLYKSTCHVLHERKKNA